MSAGEQHESNQVRHSTVSEHGQASKVQRFAK